MTDGTQAHPQGCSPELPRFSVIVTGFVYTTFFYHQDGLVVFVDALYFTVATMTTTGFGDITLAGPLCKLTSVMTMIVRISLCVRVVAP